MKENHSVENVATEAKTFSHPCFTCGASSHARIHLPVAPKCNIQCNYCVRKFDCINESRPGVVSKILSPEEAAARYDEVKKKLPNLTVVGIAGPGDALANFDEVKKTLTLIRQTDPQVTFCLSTNGLMLPFYANHLISLGVSHVTVTVNTLNADTGAKIYHHVTYLGKTYVGTEGAAILIENQLSGIRYLSSMGIVVKVNIVLLKGINEDQIEDIVRSVKACGCKITNIMKFIPVEGSAFENMEAIGGAELAQIRKKCEPILTQMYHCKQCRADAIGTLDKDISSEFVCTNKKEANDVALPSQEKYRFAVCSEDGVLIDQHFGHATQFYIYDYQDGEINLVGIRKVEKYCQGPTQDEDEGKIQKMAKMIDDCDCVVCSKMGYHPSKVLSEMGMAVYVTYHRMKDGLKEAAAKMISRKAENEINL
jgi:nitrogen fixation protein NifB